LQGSSLRLRGTSLGIIVAVTVALFSDAFLYGMLIPLIAKSRAAPENELGLAISYGAYGLGVLVATPMLASLVDRAGRRRPMLVAVLCQAGATVLFATAGDMPALLLARLVQGAASAATWTAGLALVADYFVLKRTQMMGIVMMGSSGGSVLGPLVGGMLADFGGYQLPFLVAGVFLVVDSAMRLFLIVDLPRQVSEESNLMSALRDRGVLAAALVVVLVAGGWGLVEPLLPYHLTQAVGTPASTIGLMFTFSTLANGLCAPLIGTWSERFGLWPTMFQGLIAMAVTLPLLAVSDAVLWASAILILINVSYGLAMNPSLSKLADTVDQRGTGAYGSVYAVYNIAYGVGTIGSNFLGGAIATAMSFPVALLGTSAFILVGLIAVHLLRPRGATAASPPLDTPAT
jgi:MFS transporter, DHA1 family, solute carrier family 18 (vesicular amine transporter), member 1/2